MITRYSIAISKEKLQRFYNLDPKGFKPVYNACPGQILPIIKSGNPNKLSFSEWGLVPADAVDSHIGDKLINARIKTLEAKKPFDALLPENRCVILMDSFYVMTERNAYRIRLKSHEPFTVAGLWDEWGEKESDKKMFKSFTMITQPASNISSQYNDRMPAILSKDLANVWLSTTNTIDVSALINAIKPIERADLELYEVSLDIKKSSENHISLLDPLSEDGVSTTQGSLF